jgi:hypothetical protein
MKNSKRPVETVTTMFRSLESVVPGTGISLVSPSHPKYGYITVQSDLRNSELFEKL